MRQLGWLDYLFVFASNTIYDLYSLYILLWILFVESIQYESMYVCIYIYIIVCMYISHYALVVSYLLNKSGNLQRYGPFLLFLSRLGSDPRWLFLAIWIWSDTWANASLLTWNPQTRTRCCAPKVFAFYVALVGGRACRGVKWSIYGLSFRVLHLSNVISWTFVPVCDFFSRSSRRRFMFAVQSKQVNTIMI